jgi:hypothetical protein
VIRGRLFRRGAGVAAVAAGGLLAAAAVTAAAMPERAAALRWARLAAGATTSSGTQEPVGFVAATPAQLGRVVARLAPADAATLRRVDLRRTVVVASFLDGLPCGADLRVVSVDRHGGALSVELAYTPPPVGVATCVRISTPYEVIGISRSSLARPLPTRVHVTAVARS